MKKRTEKGSVIVNGAETQYARFGTGQRNLVIIPGVSLRNVLDSAEGIASAYSMFADDYTVWIFDRRMDMPEGYTVEGMAEDLADAMKAAGIRDAYVFGTSQGGMIAQYIAARCPELVKKAVLGSTAARITDEVRTVMARWAELARRRELRELCADFADRIYSQEFLAKYREFILEFGEFASQEEIERFHIMVEACVGYDIYAELDRISCPVLVIGDKDDKVLGGAASVEIAEKLGCELYMYDGYGHAVYDEAPDYKQRLMDFFSE